MNETRCCKCKRKIDKLEDDLFGGLCERCWYKQKKIKRNKIKGDVPVEWKLLKNI